MVTETKGKELVVLRTDASAWGQIRLGQAEATTANACVELQGTRHFPSACFPEIHCTTHEPLSYLDRFD